MSAKILYYFGIILLIGHLTNAVVLNCSNLNAAKCKTEFSKQFDEESKAFHIAYSIRVLTKYIEEYNALLAELPRDDKHRAPITKKVQEFTALIQSFKAGQENVAETVALLTNLDEKFVPDLHGIEFSNGSKLLYNRLLKKHTKEINDYNNQEIPKFYVFIVNLWNQLYGSLRKSDLKAYPKYSELNTAYKGLEGSESAWKSMVYWGVVEKTTEFLELPYFQKVLNQIQAYTSDN